MPYVLPSITDRKLKSRYRGEVYRFAGGNRETIAVVYGNTLAEMWRRKRLIAELFNQEERPE